MTPLQKHLCELSVTTHRTPRVACNNIDYLSHGVGRALIQVWPRRVFQLRMALRTATKVWAREGVSLGSTGEGNCFHSVHMVVGRSWPVGCCWQLTRSEPLLEPCRPGHLMIAPVIRMSKAERQERSSKRDYNHREVVPIVWDAPQRGSAYTKDTGWLASHRSQEQEGSMRSFWKCLPS